MDILLLGNTIEIYQLGKEIELLNNNVVHLNSLTDLTSLDDNAKFDLIIFNEDVCDQITKDELEKIRVLRGRGYGVPIVVFGGDESSESDYKKKGFSKLILWSHPTEELEKFLIEVSMGKVDF